MDENETIQKPFPQPVLVYAPRLMLFDPELLVKEFTKKSSVRTNVLYVPQRYPRQQE
jgi:hypothetical protein